MKYACYDCDRKGIYTEISSNINQRFIAIDGRCLCEKCSVVVNKISEQMLEKLKLWITLIICSPCIKQVKSTSVRTCTLDMKERRSIMENLIGNLSKRLIEKGESIFIKSKSLYSYNSIINGCMVRGTSGKVEKMYAVGTNTWRGFHKIDKEGIGSKEVFVPYFNKNREKIISELKIINTVEELDKFEDKLVEDLRYMLKKCIKNNMLSSYNKVRKPVDLYIEHIVSMSEEFTSSDRERLVPLLFLPLDSQIFASEYIFSEKELYGFGLKRGSTFQDVKASKIYKAIQKILFEKSIKIHGNFHRIYFDFFWNERYKKNGTNLFETNID